MEITLANPYDDKTPKEGNRIITESSEDLSLEETSEGGISKK